MLGGVIKKSYENSSLWNLNKNELLRRIKKYEKKNNKISGIKKTSLKDDMIKYIIDNLPKIKKVKIKDTPKIIKIKNRNTVERLERKKILKEIKEGKKKYRLLSKFNYKKLPTLNEYIEIKEYNKDKKNKLKKKELLNFIKIKKNGKNKFITEDIIYLIERKPKKITLEIFFKNKKEEEDFKEFNFRINSKNKYKTEYDAKIKLIKFVRKYLDN